MKNLILTLLFLSSTALAQSLPSYYPKDGLLQVSVIDAVYPDESRIVIGDIPYTMNARPIVRSFSSAYDSMSRIRPGVRVAVRLDINGEIVEMWIFPKNYRAGPSPR